MIAVRMLYARRERAVNILALRRSVIDAIKTL